jgi:hypothetical protein
MAAAKAAGMSNLAGRMTVSRALKRNLGCALGSVYEPDHLNVYKQ